MNCRIFESQVADWLSGRLPAAVADQMTAHKAACESCAEITARETQMRLLWSHLQTPSTEASEKSNRLADADLWPRISARIETPAPRQSLFGWLYSDNRQQSTAGGSWTRSLATAACTLAILVPVAVCLNLNKSTTTPPHTNVAVRPAAPAVPVAGATAKADAAAPALTLSFFGDEQGDPTIDDPVGGTMEHVWKDVSTDNDAANH